MDAILQTLTQTVRYDVRELVHAAKVEVPTVVELDPPNARWGIPRGFASLFAAGILLAAAGIVQARVDDRIHHRAHQPKRPRHPLHPHPGAAPRRV